MSRQRITACVRVRLVVEVTPSDTWGEECGIPQIEKQGREAALGRLLGILALAPNGGVRVVEEPASIDVVLKVERR